MFAHELLSMVIRLSPSPLQIPIDCLKQLWAEKTHPNSRPKRPIYQGQNDPPQLLAETTQTSAHLCNIRSGMAFCKTILESKRRCGHSCALSKRPMLKRPSRNDTGLKKKRSIYYTMPHSLCMSIFFEHCQYLNTTYRR